MQHSIIVTSCVQAKVKCFYASKHSYISKKPNERGQTHPTCYMNANESLLPCPTTNERGQTHPTCYMNANESLLPCPTTNERGQTHPTCYMNANNRTQLLEGRLSPPFKRTKRTKNKHSSHKSLKRTLSVTSKNKPSDQQLD